MRGVDVSFCVGDYHAARYRGTFARSGAIDSDDTDSLVDLLLRYRKEHLG